MLNVNNIASFLFEIVYIGSKNKINAYYCKTNTYKKKNDFHK